MPSIIFKSKNDEVIVIKNKSLKKDYFEQLKIMAKKQGGHTVFSSSFLMIEDFCFIEPKQEKIPIKIVSQLVFVPVFVFLCHYCRTEFKITQNGIYLSESMRVCTRLEILK